MRNNTNAFLVKNDSLHKEPRLTVVVAFDEAATDLVYFTSHNDTPLPEGAISYSGILEEWSATSQTLKPEKANASIGNISFSVIDYNEEISQLLATRYLNSESLKGKLIKVYMNYEGLSWADAALIQTQVIDVVTTKDGRFSFSCSDVQRFLKKKIFITASTTLQSSISKDADVINVYDTSSFEPVAHGSSYSDAPNQTVYYFKIEKEIVRATDKTSGTFTGCVRGVLNTKAVAHEINPDSDPDRRTKVEEVVYLEMPVPKLIRALLTGDLYGQGVSLPANWHAGMSDAYVRTSSFTQIGSDYWDTTDDSKGLIVRFVGEKDQDAKKFIEEQLLLLLGCYMPVHGDGALGLQRMVQVLSDAQHVKELNIDNTTSYGTLKHDLPEVRNIIDIAWNWEEGKNDFTRHHLLIDQESINRYGKSKVLNLKFRGLYGNIHSKKTLDAIFSRLRSRFTSEPLRISVDGFFSLNSVEIGDVVKLNLPYVKDYTANSFLNRAFEVQRNGVDWITGRTTFNLFGSTLKPSPSALSDTPTVLPDSWYTSEGTDIKTLVGYSAGVLTASITINGHADLNNPAAIYYHDGDLTIPDGVIITITGNVWFRIKGHRTLDGKINGAGNGITTEATAGYLGTAKAQGGINTTMIFGTFTSAKSFDVNTTSGIHKAIPEIDVVYDNISDKLNGVPSDLRGTTGNRGGNVNLNNGYRISGGVHGNSGAGFCETNRGSSFGVSGAIDLSGDDGATGAVWGDYFASGAGAGGAAGTWYTLLDGSAAIATINTGNFIAKRGLAPPRYNPQDNPNEIEYYISSYYVGFSNDDSWQSNHLVQVIPSAGVIEADTPVDATDPLSVSVTELTNKPLSPAGNLSSLEILVNPPSDSNYSYSKVYYRVQGQTVWSFIGNANNEVVQVVPSDGITYEIEARAVSIWGVENEEGVSTSITVTDIITPELNIDVNVTDTLAVPDVSGLELFEGGNSEEFTGKDAKFTWRKSSNTNSYFIGSEPTGLGSNTGGLDLYFLDYEVRVYDGETLLRTENVTDNFYIYSYEKNVEDYERINTITGAYRSFRIEIYNRSQQGQYSTNAARLSVSNPAPELPSGINLKANFRTLLLEYILPDDLDFAGVKIWIGTSTGFVRNDTSKVYQGVGTNIILDVLGDGSALEPNTTYYVYMLAYDAFGDVGTESVELSATTLQVINSDIALLAVDTPQIADFAVDAAKIELLAVKEAHIDNLAVTSAKILSLAASKITADIISASLVLANSFVLTTSGVIRSAVSFGAAGIFLGWDSTAYKFYVGDGAKKFIKFDGDNFTLGSDVNIRSADSYSSDTEYLSMATPQQFTYEVKDGTGIIEELPFLLRITAAVGPNTLEGITYVRSTLFGELLDWGRDHKIKIKFSVGGNAEDAECGFILGGYNWNDANTVGIYIDESFNVIGQVNNRATTLSMGVAGAGEVDYEILTYATGAKVGKAEFYREGIYQGILSGVLTSGTSNYPLHLYVKNNSGTGATKKASISIGRIKYFQGD